MPRSWWHWKWSWMSRLKHSTVAPSRTPWLFHEWSPDIVRYLWGCRFCSYCQVGKAPLSSLDSFEKRPASKARFCRQQVFFYDVLAERSFSVKTPVTFENFAVGFSHSWGSEICKNYWSSHLVWFVRTYGVLRCLGFLHKSGSRNWKISHLLQKQKVFNGVSPLNFHRNEKLCSFFRPLIWCVTRSTGGTTDSENSESSSLNIKNDSGHGLGKSLAKRMGRLLQ